MERRKAQPSLSDAAIIRDATPNKAAQRLAALHHGDFWRGRVLSGTPGLP